MAIEIGQVEAIFRYPVKSMAGERRDAAELGWHGLAGDRRLALRRIADRGGFPWLSAGELPELVRFVPQGPPGAGETDLPTHVRTPEGEELPIFGDELAADIGRRHGAPVQMMQLRQGIFDQASISVITTDTVGEIARLAALEPDVRQFRPNFLVRLLRLAPFQEDQWVGRSLSFGHETEAPTVAVTMRDLRCSMVNLDPDSAHPAPAVLKAIGRVNEANAGIYAVVTRTGRVSVGDPVLLHDPTGSW